MRLSPSLFRSLLRSLASTPTCTNTGPYGCAPYAHTRRIPPYLFSYTASPRYGPLSNSWLVYIHKQKVKLTTFHYS